MKDPCLFDFGQFFGSINVKRLSFEEIGVYIRMLFIQWADGRVPGDPETLSLVLSEGSRSIDPSGAQVLLQGPLSRCFTVDGNGDLFNETMDEQREAWIFKKQVRAKNSSSGGKKRAKNARVALSKLKKTKDLEDSSATQVPLELGSTGTQGEPKDHSTISVSVSGSVSGSVSNQEKTKSGPCYDHDFDEIFWPAALAASKLAKEALGVKSGNGSGFRFAAAMQAAKKAYKVKAREYPDVSAEEFARRAQVYCSEMTADTLRRRESNPDDGCYVQGCGPWLAQGNATGDVWDTPSESSGSSRSDAVARYNAMDHEEQVAFFARPLKKSAPSAAVQDYNALSSEGKAAFWTDKPGAKT